MRRLAIACRRLGAVHADAGADRPGTHDPGGVRPADPSGMRLRVDSVDGGVAATLLVCALGGIYAVEFAPTAHRLPVVLLFAAAACGGLAARRLPWRRIVRTRWREPAFVAWYLVNLTLAVAVILADGGAQSPLALILFVLVVFASVSYPVGSVTLLTALTICSYLAVALRGTVGGSQLAFVAALICTSVPATWQALHYTRERGKLAEISRVDALTGCLNRRGFEEVANAELARARRTRSEVALLVLDLDGFKETNDTHGHAAGDEVLRWVAATARSILRPSDALGRVGGDEFAVVLPAVSRAGAEQAATRLSVALAARAPCSTGVACSPRDGLDLTCLLARADGALYERKVKRAPPAAWPAADALSA